MNRVVQRMRDMAGVLSFGSVWAALAVWIARDEDVVTAIMLAGLAAVLLLGIYVFLTSIPERLHERKNRAPWWDGLEWWAMGAGSLALGMFLMSRSVPAFDLEYWLRAWFGLFTIIVAGIWGAIILLVVIMLLSGGPSGWRRKHRAPDSTDIH